MGQLGCVVYLFVGGVQFTITDILHDSSCKQVGILQYNAQRMTKVIFFDLIDINSVIADLTIRHIVETVDQVCDGGLSGSCGTNESQLLSRFRIQSQVMEHHMIRHIAKGHIIKLYLASQLSISNSAVCLMRVFPRPHTGTLFTLHNIAVCIFLCVHQGNISLIHFRLGIHHVEDTLGAGQSHDDGVKLLSDLHERLCETLGKLQIGCHDTQRDIADSHNGKEAAKYRCQHEQQVTHVTDDRSHDTCEGVRLGSALKQFLVEFIKLFFGHFFMVKYLYHTLSAHAFFHKTSDIGQIQLLTDEVTSAVA